MFLYIGYQKKDAHNEICKFLISSKEQGKDIIENSGILQQRNSKLGRKGTGHVGGHSCLPISWLFYLFTY